MNALSNLVRISRWHLDEKRQTLADMERLREKLQGDVERLDRAVAAERALAEADEEARRAFPAYAESERNRRDRLYESIAEVDRQIETAREEVRAAFREVKKYELALANRDSQERRKRERVETAALDEIGLQLHRRKRNAGG